MSISSHNPNAIHLDFRLAWNVRLLPPFVVSQPICLQQQIPHHDLAHAGDMDHVTLGGGKNLLAGDGDLTTLPRRRQPVPQSQRILTHPVRLRQ